MNFLILYHCAKSAFVLSSYATNLEFSNNLAQHAPDKEFTIICKALLACLSLRRKETPDSAILQEVELSKITIMLRSELSVPFSVHGLSFSTLFSMLNDLTIVSENQKNFLKMDLLSVIAELVDRLLLQEQEAAAEVISALLQENYSTTNIPTDIYDANQSNLHSTYILYINIKSKTAKL